jgi:undecaprenyl-diphosphatase
MMVALARILRSSDPIEVDVDGVHRRLWLLFAGNCVYSPPGFAPSWRDRLDDGLLDLRLIDATRPYARSRLIVAVLTGRLAKTPVFEARTATSVRVRSLAEGVRLARDGEVGEPVPGFALTKAGHLRVYRP